MNWIIQDSNNEHKNWVRIYCAAIAAGDSAQYISIEDDEEIMSIDKKSIVIGGDDFVEKCISNSCLKQGIFLDDDFFNTDNYIRVFKDNFLNYDSKHMRFNEVYSLGDIECFIRPYKDIKLFDGAVYKISEFIEQYKNIILSDELLMISTPKKISSEWRFVVVNNSIITYSRYVGTDNIDSKAIDFLNHLLYTIIFPPALVIDVAYTYNGFKVIECNVINSSNFYDCDMNSIVLALDAIFY